MEWQGILQLLNALFAGFLFLCLTADPPAGSRPEGQYTRELAYVQHTENNLAGNTTHKCAIQVLLFPVDRATHEFFAVFRLTFLIPRVCFKPIAWYIEMHHVRAFFWCGVVIFHVYLEEKSLPWFLPP